MCPSDNQADQPYRILVIDDDPHILSQVRRILEQRDHETITATSGQAGLALFQQREPHLVLIDVDLTDADGFSLLIRMKERRRHIPVMMVAPASEVAVVSALRQGADDFLSKPIVPEELLERVQRNLEKGQQSRARAELTEQLQQQLSTLLSLQEMAREASSAADLYHLLKRLLDQAVESMQLDAGIILVSENGELVPVAHHGLSRAIASSLTRQRLTWQDPPLRPFRQATGALLTHGEKQQGGPLSRSVGYRFTAIVPLLAHGRRWGLMEIASKDERAVPKEDLEILTTLGQQIALALANARLQEAATLRLRELALLNEACLALTSELNLEQILTTIMLRTSDVIGVETGSLFLADEESGELIFRIVLGEQASDILSRRVPPGKGIAGWVFQHGHPLLVPDVNEDHRYYPEVDRHTGFHTRSTLCVPLQVRGETLGVVELVNKISGEFTDDDLRLLESVAALTATAIAQTRLHEWTTSFVLIDPLTHLPNHKFLLQVLDREAARCRRYERTCSLLLLSVDRRLQLSESLWRKLAAMIKENLRQSDLLCRHREGPLVAVLPETTVAGARTLADRLRDQIGQSNLQEPDGVNLLEHIRIGFVTYPQEVEDPAGLLKGAEHALARAWEKSG